MTLRLSYLYPFAIMLLIVVAYTVVSRGIWLIDFGGADNWSYVKYFHSWGNAPPALRIGMDGDYKGSRLPWIVPGYLYFQVFGDTLGSYLLHISVLLLTAGCLYIGIKRLFDQESAIISASIILINPAFHSSNTPGFWYYHEAIALLYYAVACLGIVLATTSARFVGWSLLAGFGLCASLLTSLTYVAFLPAFGVFCLILHRRRPARRFLLAAGAILLGGLGAVVGFGLMNVLVGGRFLFFSSQIEYTLRYTSTGGLWLPPEAWFHRSTWLAFPLVVPVGLGLALALRWRRTAGCDALRTALLACAAHLYLASAALLVFEIRGQPVLQVPYISHQLFGPGAYGIGAILAVVGRRGGAPARWLIAVAVAVGVLLPQFIVTSQQRVDLRIWLTVQQAVAGLPESQLWGVAGLLLVGGLALVVSRWSRSAVAVLAAGVLLGVGVAVAAPPGEPYLPPQACDSREAQFQLVHQAARWAMGDPRGSGAALGRASTEQASWSDAGTALWYAPDEEATGSEGCPPIPLRSLYIALSQATALAPPLAVGVDLPAPGAMLEYRALEPERRAWSLLVVASAAEHAPSDRARFESWLAGAPTPVPWRYLEAVDLRQDGVAVVLSIYELPRAPGRA